MFRVKTRSTGGKRLDASLDRHKRQLRSMGKQTVVEIGVKGQFLASLAAVLEFGSTDGRIRERPAFRMGSRNAMPKMRAKVLELRRGGMGDVPTEAEIIEVAKVAHEELEKAYKNYSGSGVGERQARRKLGTPGEGRELVGAQGPKLVEHISAWINSVKVA